MKKVISDKRKKRKGNPIFDLEKVRDNDIDYRISIDISNPAYGIQ